MPTVLLLPPVLATNETLRRRHHHPFTLPSFLLHLAAFIGRINPGIADKLRPTDRFLPPLQETPSEPPRITFALLINVNEAPYWLGSRPNWPFKGHISFLVFHRSIPGAVCVWRVKKRSVSARLATLFWVWFGLGSLLVGFCRMFFVSICRQKSFDLKLQPRRFDTLIKGKKVDRRIYH